MTVRLDNVSSVVGGVPHLADVSLTLERGSLNVLLGPTLAGKTSLMRLMAGLDVPSAGRVVVEGRDVTGVHVRRRSVAMVYQQFINYPSLTVYENIASPLRVAGRPRQEIDAKVQDTARLLHLEPYLQRTPLELSGGQQQRTAIARALVKRAELVLLDEPLANLDYKLREELREELPRIFAASGAIFVYATTEPTEALLLGGSTATLFEGRITQFGPTPQVYRRPQDLVTARVFSDPPLNVLSAVKSGGLVTLDTGATVPAGGVFAAIADGPCRIGFRAHQLHLEALAPGAIAMPATVSVAEITGSESFIHVDVKLGGQVNGGQVNGGQVNASQVNASQVNASQVNASQVNASQVNASMGDGGKHRFVALVKGVRRFEPGAAINVHLDPHHLFLFDAADRLIAAPGLARAA